MHILLAACIFGLASSDLIVNTNTGPIKGVLSTVDDVEAFLGIPYAEPTVGDLRFAKPVAKTQWTEIYDATKLPPACPQPDLGPYIFMADVSKLSEDCLYLNIWTSKPNATQNLKPVIIFIHPGAFITGSSNIKVYDGSYLASRGNLVVASISYRLGALGFFLASTKKANGNMGMFDQIMAIEWIKSNAKHFGGDPENLVLMGSSAGAYSATAHMVSPLSKNLFKRVILQSGSIINPMFLDNNERLFKNSQAVASMLGCTNETTSLEKDPEIVIQCLKTKPKEDFARAEKILLMSNPGVFFPAANDEFLPKSSVDLYREGKFSKDVDVMVGVVEDEGSLFLFSAMHDYFGYYGRNEDNAMTKLRALGLSRRLLASLGQNNSSEIIDYYLKNTKHRTSIDYKKIVANIFGDFEITCNAVFAADFTSLKDNQVYFYKFGFRPVATPMAQWTGAMHTDELQYIFMKPFYGNFTDEEIELSHNLIDRWSAFAKKGPGGGCRDHHLIELTAEISGLNRTRLAYKNATCLASHILVKPPADPILMVDRNPNIPGHIPWLRYSYHNPLYLYFGQEEESIRMKPNDRCQIWRKRYNANIDSELIRRLKDSESTVSAVSKDHSKHYAVTNK